MNPLGDFHFWWSNWYHTSPSAINDHRTGQNIGSHCLGGIVQQAAQCCNPIEKGNPQGSSTILPVLCLGKTSHWHILLDFRQNNSDAAGLRRQESEFSQFEEAGIFKTRHHRRKSYIKEGLHKSIWGISKNFWLRTGCMFIGVDYLRLTRGYRFEKG